MAKQRKTILILGEGPTEFYYFNSLSDRFKGLNIKPDIPKHANLKQLEQKIKEGVDMSFDYIYCIIDMDTKDSEPERTQYAKLKQAYASPIVKPKKGINCEVKFVETHRCTELFFLYYFKYTSRMYDSQDPLLKDLNQQCEYHKTIDFFKKCKGLHSYFEKKGGSLDDAIANAERSMRDKQADNRDYTYSELGKLMIELNSILNPQSNSENASK
ncbi:MAG: RloB family protein [Bacteroidales bacterium]|nr:RloB family protein [Bacteroidales bacterium]